MGSKLCTERVLRAMSCGGESRGTSELQQFVNMNVAVFRGAVCTMASLAVYGEAAVIPGPMAASAANGAVTATCFSKRTPLTGR